MYCMSLTSSKFTMKTIKTDAINIKLKLFLSHNESSYEIEILIYNYSMTHNYGIIKCPTNHQIY